MFNETSLLFHFTVSLTLNIKYNFTDAQEDFKGYREMIKNEPVRFKSDVKKIFVD
jgi:hypothetical protein